MIQLCLSFQNWLCSELLIKFKDKCLIKFYLFDNEPMKLPFLLQHNNDYVAIDSLLERLVQIFHNNLVPWKEKRYWCLVTYNNTMKKSKIPQYCITCFPGAPLALLFSADNHCSPEHSSLFSHTNKNTFQRFQSLLYTLIYQSLNIICLVNLVNLQKTWGHYFSRAMLTSRDLRIVLVIGWLFSWRHFRLKSYKKYFIKNFQKVIL